MACLSNTPNAPKPSAINIPKIAALRDELCITTSLL
jgi:hypothetical protein